MVMTRMTKMILVDHDNICGDNTKDNQNHAYEEDYLSKKNANYKDSGVDCHGITNNCCHWHGDHLFWC